MTGGQVRVRDRAAVDIEDAGVGGAGDGHGVQHYGRRRVGRRCEHKEQGGGHNTFPVPTPLFKTGLKKRYFAEGAGFAIDFGRTDKERLSSATISATSDQAYLRERP